MGDEREVAREFHRPEGLLDQAIPNLPPVAALLEGDIDFVVKIAQLLLEAAAVQRTNVATFHFARRLARRLAHRLARSLACRLALDLPPPIGLVREAASAGNFVGAGLGG